jgi:hypothetical protein
MCSWLVVHCGSAHALSTHAFDPKLKCRRHRMDLTRADDYVGLRALTPEGLNSMLSQTPVEGSGVMMAQNAENRVLVLQSYGVAISLTRMG